MDKSTSAQSARQSKIATDLIENYRCAIYQIGTGPDTITLPIDQYSESLSPQLAASDPSCALFITAFNPFSQRKNYQENLACNTKLYIELNQHAHLIMGGISSDPLGRWPAEEGFLAFGINLKAAEALGKRFGQNAIVWIDTDAMPRLILLR